MGMAPGVARRLAELDGRPLNYDADALDLSNPGRGWHVDDRFQALPGEDPGLPQDGGSFAVAARLIRGYAFADPSQVRAHYDPEVPMQGRNMLLELRALNLVRVYVGVRINAVYEDDIEHDGRPVHRFGWSYRTLQGHVERGQMNWEVFKWIDSGEVAFHVHAVSRPARIANPVIAAGFLVLRGHERSAFLNRTDRRMRELTERGVNHSGPSGVSTA